MTSITVTYNMPDDMTAFNQAHHASLAWSTLNEIAGICRNHLKHDAPIDIRQIQQLALEALGVIE
jgi:hypothetical protein